MAEDRSLSDISEMDQRYGASSFFVNRFKVHFMYPFKIDNWEGLKSVVTQLVDEHSRDLFEQTFPDSIRRLEDEGDAHKKLVDGVKHIITTQIDTYSGGRRNRRQSNHSFVEIARAIIRTRAQVSQNGNVLGSALLCQVLKELVSDHEADADCRFLKFLEQRINAGSQQTLLLPSAVHEYEDTGTRSYLDKKEPFLVIPLKGHDVGLANPQSLPDAGPKLADGGQIRLRPTIKVWASGFGCLRFRAHLTNEQGLDEIVEEVVFSAHTDHGHNIAEELRIKLDLAAKIKEDMKAAVHARDPDQIRCLNGQDESALGSRGDGSIKNRLGRIVEELTLVEGPIGVRDIVDVQNLDRGFERGDEPRFIWNSNQGEPLQHYFEHVLLEFLANVKSLIKEEEKERIEKFLARLGDDRRFREIAEIKTQEQLLFSLSNLSPLQDWQAPERHPYVTTFVSWPERRDPDSCTLAQMSKSFERAVEEHRGDLAKLLMKTKWDELRWETWKPLHDALDNVFYSDLIYIAIHLRGALCVYCVPPGPEYYLKRPELRYAYKYREELRNTIENQRMLWYAYKTFDALVTRDFAGISQTFGLLKEETGQEEFQEMIEDLTDVIRTIESRKIEVAEVMEEPFTRKGGSSLFSEMLERSSKAFRLKELYHNLCHKLERLDMLGIHINETIHEYSNLMVQEGTRATQLTLEFIEAIIIAFYGAHLTHFGIEYMLKGLESEPQLVEGFHIAMWWIFYAIAAGLFLTALPVITMVRKSRARFPVRDPDWLEWLERIGIIIGPLIVLFVTGLVFNTLHLNERYGIGAYQMVIWLVLVYLLIIRFVGFRVWRED